MNSVKQLTLLAEQFSIKLAQTGEYGGKGPFELPSTHKAAMQVTKGGSSCNNCKFVDAANHACLNKYYIQWNGGDGKLPERSLDSTCSDWWEPV